MPSASATSRRRSLLLALVAVLAIAALVVGGLLWRDRFGSGEQEAEDLAAALSAGEVPSGADADTADMHERILGPLLEAGALPDVALPDPGSAADGTPAATREWPRTHPDDAGTGEY
ncbi:MAG: cell division protein FtsI, partial [Brachybacterium sp.]|nr:cell division protein FtsI [Brachybacterium sp.]